jgi:2-succinyl-5-enolpyruvyl-6-hydroxy-3-cyclohexene-1-carboxylate synthase
MQAENRTYAWAGAFVDELARAGLRHVCICPGSRSTPAAVSFARHPLIKKWLHLDERSASFFAMGIAQALEEPVAVVCTSGTAAANFLPSVIEARYGVTPLILITTDRPPELWDWGAPQAMDQTGLFGAHAKWSVTMPPPEATPELFRYVRALAGRVHATALATPAGPVHVNMSFREPLSPVEAPEELQRAGADLEALYGREMGQPYTHISAGVLAPDPAVIQRLSRELRATERGVIVCGPQRLGLPTHAVASLASRLGYPVLADPLSQARTGLLPNEALLKQGAQETVIDTYDLFLRDPELAESLAPEVVVRFGAWPTSKWLTTYLEQNRRSRHILVASDGWSDPSHLNSELVRADSGLFCQALADGAATSRSTKWLKRWTTARDRAREAAHAQLGEMEELFEGKLFSELAELLPEGSALFAGNSMPVRDMDTFLAGTRKEIRCLANRGVNGIDGVVSTALGHSGAWEGRTVLVIGDISFYHDMNGLLAARRYGMDATIIVVNNDGGGIFSFLPQANYPEFFEEYLGTPHGLEFGPVAELYGLSHTKVGTWDEFRSAVSASLATPGTAIVEVPGDRKRNFELHRQVSDAVLTSLQRQATS